MVHDDRVIRAYAQTLMAQLLAAAKGDAAIVATMQRAAAEGLTFQLTGVDFTCAQAKKVPPPPRPVTVSDRRFLRSLRITWPDDQPPPSA